jgi:hypothetical protein
MKGRTEREDAAADSAYTSNGLNQYTASGSATLSYDANCDLAADGWTSYVCDPPASSAR